MDTSYNSSKNLEAHKKILQKIFIVSLILNVLVIWLIFSVFGVWKWLYSDFLLYYQGKETIGTYNWKYEQKTSQHNGNYSTHYNITLTWKCEDKNFTENITQKTLPKNNTIYKILCVNNNNKTIIAEKDSINITLTYFVAIFLLIWLFGGEIYWLYLIKHPEKFIKSPQQNS